MPGGARTSTWHRQAKKILTKNNKPNIKKYGSES